tara:strand:- start:165 stop:410 length:246 start_codon:yes stop_codon:yes gene_type:complete
MVIKEKKIKKIISKVLKISTSKVNDKLAMNSFAKWDSLSHLKIVLAIEGNLKVSFKEEDVTQITSYKLIKLYLKKMRIKII